MKERQLVLELRDIYGGDGIERPHEVEEIAFSETNTTITVRQDLGVEQSREYEKKQKRTKEVSVRTFRRDDDGQPMYRLGGAHGKCWGALREAAESMYDTDEISLSLTAIEERFMPVVQISPQWVRLETPGDPDEVMEVDVLPQILNTRDSSMVEHYFDVLPFAAAEVTISYPETYEQPVEKCLDRLETLNFGNKRRSSVIVHELSDLDVETAKEFAESRFGSSVEGTETTKAVADDD